MRDAALRFSCTWKLLIDAHLQVGIVEEMETALTANAKPGPRKVVDRSLRRLFSPGTIVEESMLGSESRPAFCILPDSKGNRFECNFILCMMRIEFS